MKPERDHKKDAKFLASVAHPYESTTEMGLHYIRRFLRAQKSRRQLPGDRDIGRDRETLVGPDLYNRAPFIALYWLEQADAAENFVRRQFRRDKRGRFV